MYPGAYTPTGSASTFPSVVIVVNSSHTGGTAFNGGSSFDRALRRMARLVDGFAHSVRNFKEYVDKAIVNAALWAALMKAVRPRMPEYRCPCGQCPIGCSRLAARPRGKLRRWRSLKERRAAWGRLTT